MKAVFFMFVMLWSVAAQAAITYDTSSYAPRTSLQTSLTFSHATADQTDRVMIAGCFIVSDTTARTVTGMTYNGDAMTLVDTIGDPANQYMRVYELAAPDTGTHDVVGSFSGAGDGYQACWAETWYGVDQMTLNRTVSKRTSGETNEGSSSLSPVSSSSNDIVLDFIVWRYSVQGTVTIGGGQTERVSIMGASQAAMKGSSEPGAGATTTMSWSWAEADITSDCHLAFALIPAAGTPAGFPLKDIFTPIIVQ